tara:strand:+ start:145 stop:450 length:306 start_codon:yes stop_codon:yes gene_type:complete
METCGVNITKKIQEKYKRHLETVEELLLDVNWVVDKRNFDRFINTAICLREKIKEIEIELVVDKIRKKIYDGGRIEVSDLNEIEGAGWPVPKVIWVIVKSR